MLALLNICLEAHKPRFNNVKKIAGLSLWSTVMIISESLPQPGIRASDLPLRASKGFIHSVAALVIGWGDFESATFQNAYEYYELLKVVGISSVGINGLSFFHTFFITYSSDNQI